MPDYAALLAKIRSARIVFVNTASSSGEFLKGLAGPGRTIVTATKTGGERNETRFPAFFVEAFTGDEADRDRNGRISVQEAFEYARTKVQQAFEREGYVLSEHATLEDGGAGLAGTLYLESDGRSRPRSPASRIPRCARRSRRSGASKIKSPGSGCASRACRRINTTRSSRSWRRRSRRRRAPFSSSKGRRSDAPRLGRDRGVALLAGTVAYAQFGGGPRSGGGNFGAEPIRWPNAPYDGKFTFVRVRYGPPVGYASQRVMWSHDYPTGERNFMKILNEVTYLGPHIDETNILVARRSRAVQVSRRLS